MGASVISSVRIISTRGAQGTGGMDDGSELTALNTVFLLCLQAVSECDLNPLARNYLASPVAIDSLKAVCVKMLLVVVSAALDSFAKAQAALMLIFTWFTSYYVCDSVRFVMLAY